MFGRVAGRSSASNTVCYLPQTCSYDSWLADIAVPLFAHILHVYALCPLPLPHCSSKASLLSPLHLPFPSNRLHCPIESQLCVPTLPPCTPVQCVGRALRGKTDYGIMVFADKVGNYAKSFHTASRVCRVTDLHSRTPGGLSYLPHTCMLKLSLALWLKMSRSKKSFSLSVPL